MGVRLIPWEYPGPRSGRTYVRTYVYAPYTYIIIGSTFVHTHSSPRRRREGIDICTYPFQPQEEEGGDRHLYIPFPAPGGGGRGSTFVHTHSSPRRRRKGIDICTYPFQPKEEEEGYRHLYIPIPAPGGGGRGSTFVHTHSSPRGRRKGIDLRTYIPMLAPGGQGQYMDLSPFLGPRYVRTYVRTLVPY